MGLVANKRRAVLLLLAGLAAAVALVVGGCGGDKGTGPSNGEETTYTLTVNRNPADGGTTNPTSSQSGISAGGVINITATAASGYMFNGWTLSGSGIIDNAGAATTSVTVNGNVTVTANFAENNNCKSDATCKQVTIGTQVWMAENLNIATASGSWCYGNSADSCVKYGRLYNWATAKTVCPTGWHLPTRDEWGTLSYYVASGWAAGGKLKSTSGWYDWDGNNSGNGTDEYGFSALPGGYRYSDGSFYYVGNDGYWWTATEYRNDEAYVMNIEYYDDSMPEYPYALDNGISVRCVGD